MRIGVLTGGGDAPGLNPAIAGIVERATMDGFEVVGLKRGWQALAIRENDSHVVKLGPEIIREYSRLGGSKIQCSRTNPVSPKNDRTDIVKENMKKFKLDAVIAIGGEDTLGAAEVLSERGVPVVGIPKTIDRDLAGTEYTLGYDTALNVICESAERVAHTAESHETIFFLEVMGRHAGWLALRGGESAFADVILIPEYTFSVAEAHLGAEREAEGDRRSESGLRAPVQDHRRRRGRPHRRRGSGAARQQARRVRALQPRRGGGLPQGPLEHEFKHTRYTALAYLQRGAPPSQRDRQIGRRFGHSAVELVKDGKFGHMVAVQKSKLVVVPLREVRKSPRLVDVDKLYDKERLNVKIENPLLDT